MFNAHKNDKNCDGNVAPFDSLNSIKHKAGHQIGCPSSCEPGSAQKNLIYPTPPLFQQAIKKQKFNLTLLISHSQIIGSWDQSSFIWKGVPNHQPYHLRHHFNNNHNKKASKKKINQEIKNIKRFTEKYYIIFNYDK